MDKWNLIVDLALCNNCASCTLASMDEHVGNDFPGYAAPLSRNARPLLDMRRHVRGEGEHIDVTYMPSMCHHCDVAACGAGTDEAFVKRQDGIVIIDPVKAKGRRDIVGKCPYGAIRWNDELQLPQIWIFDAHLLDAGWPMPRCQQSCASGVFWAIKVSDERMQALARQEGLEVYRPEFGTRPRVYFRNLNRILKRFVAGSVVVVGDDATDCLAGCTVSLRRDGELLAQATTDWFGDFKLDGLADAALDYELLFEHPVAGTRRLPVRTDTAGTSVGVVTLSLPSPAVA